MSDFNERRTRLVCAAIVTIYALLLAAVFYHTAFGTRACDFVQFWAAAVLAREGRPAAPYDVESFHAFENRVIGRDVPNIVWRYPPSLLVLVFPLSFMPYSAAFIVWTLLGLGLFALAVRRLTTHPLAPWLALAFPATYLNAAYGQNGLFTASFIIGGLALLETSPLAAGMILGLVTFKPHLAVLVPLALLVGRRFHALAGFAASSAVLMVTSVAAFGTEPWRAFFELATTGQELVFLCDTNFHAMVTVWASVYMATSERFAAGAAQAVVSVVVVTATLAAWYGNSPTRLRFGFLAIACLLATPYAFVYDLAIVTVAMVVMWDEARRTGWLPGEFAAVSLNWALLPFLPSLAYGTRVSLASPLLVVLFACLVRRSFRRD